MSASTLPVPPPPSFPQIPQHQNQRWSTSADPTENDDKRSLCSYVSPESNWGACDGGLTCDELAIDGEFCRKHGVSRG